MQPGLFSSLTVQVLVVAAELAACQTPPVPPSLEAVALAIEPSPVDGVGYIVLDAPIDRDSSTQLIQKIDELKARGARKIDCGINSPGGELDAAGAIVFLDAQCRYAVSRSGIVFHAPSKVVVGTFSAETLRDDADQLDRWTQMVRDVLLVRTHLTKQQVDVYVTRIVLLSTVDAQHDGVIDAVRSMTLPKGAREWLVRAKRCVPAQGVPNRTSCRLTGGLEFLADDEPDVAAAIVQTIRSATSWPVAARSGRGVARPDLTRLVSFPRILTASTQIARAAPAAGPTPRRRA